MISGVGLAMAKTMAPFAMEETILWRPHPARHADKDVRSLPWRPSGFLFSFHGWVFWAKAPARGFNSSHPLAEDADSGRTGSNFLPPCEKMLRDGDPRRARPVDDRLDFTRCPFLRSDARL
jgi:hypothetical protein